MSYDKCGQEQSTCAGEVSLVRTLSAVVGGAVSVLHGDCGMPQGLGMLAMWMISYWPVGELKGEGRNKRNLMLIQKNITLVQTIFDVAERHVYF